MCAGCVTTVDTAAVGLTGAACALAGAWNRYSLRRRGAADDRRTRVWEANAALLERLGQDPVRVLGPRPNPPGAPPVRDDARVPALTR